MSSFIDHDQMVARVTELAAAAFARHPDLVELPRIEVRVARRGHYNVLKHLIVIPVWVFTGTPRVKASGKPGYIEWYVAHEVAHAIRWRGWSRGFPRPPGGSHGLVFQSILRKVCPPEFYHFEAGYKPRRYKQALAAGQSGGAP